MKYWNVIITEVPELFKKLSQRILGTQLVKLIMLKIDELMPLYNNIVKLIMLKIDEVMLLYNNIVNIIMLNIEELMPLYSKVMTLIMTNIDEVMIIYTNVVKMLMTKIGEVMAMYPEEIKAIQDIVILYMNICMEYATWVINTIVEHPSVQMVVEFIVTFTPEKAQAILVRSIILRCILRRFNWRILISEYICNFI